MVELKTKKNAASVQAFLDAVPDARRRKECQLVLRLMQKVTGEAPSMWGTSIVGFGQYTYHYASGRESQWMLTGFSPRKQNLTLYIMPGFQRFPQLMQALGKHKTGKSCLYLNTLDDVDLGVLEQLVSESVAHMRRVGHDVRAAAARKRA